MTAKQVGRKACPLQLTPVAIVIGLMLPLANAHAQTSAATLPAVTVTGTQDAAIKVDPVSYTHLRAHET